MRLIDADDLLEKLMKSPRYFDLKFDIDNAPTIAEPVVHCKDCKHNPKGIGWVSCPMTGANTRKPDDFCNYGERREP